MNRALCFIFGVIAGTALGYYIARQRCEEEIESVKEAFREDSEREESSVDHNEADENPDREPIDSSIRPAVKEAIDYMNTVRKAGYTAAPDPTDEDEVSDIPYEITPNEFGDIEYELCLLTMYWLMVTHTNELKMLIMSWVRIICRSLVIMKKIVFVSAMTDSNAIMRLSEMNEHMSRHIKQCILINLTAKMWRINGRKGTIF